MRTGPSFGASLSAISKSFGSVHANKDVDLYVRPQTIHALIGENGAGKSTAMKILFGLITPDSGKILFDGIEVSHWTPHKAITQGVGMVHQHFMLAGNETVHDNLVLGVEKSKCGFRDRRKETLELTALMKKTGLKVPLDTLINQMPIGLQSRCEILKVLYRSASFLILDEPTAVLTPQEIEGFLSTLKNLRELGHTILIVTHKLKEVIDVADEATILRSGKTVATRKISETNIEELSELMVGRRLQMPKVKRKTDNQSSKPLLKLESIQFQLELYSGEIVGIAGVEGNGQEELVASICNSKETHSKLAVLGYSKPLRELPVGIIPADRQKEGLVLSFSLTENLRLGRAQMNKSSWAYFPRFTDLEKKVLSDFDVRPPQLDLKAAALSGGNQQKLIVGRELAGLPRESIVIAVHPTRGVDMGAIEFIHGKILQATELGAAVLLISSELDELISLSHRIGVIYRGHIVKWLIGPPYDEMQIGRLMLAGLVENLRAS